MTLVCWLARHIQQHGMLRQACEQRRCRLQPELPQHMWQWPRATRATVRSGSSRPRKARKTRAMTIQGPSSPTRFSSPPLSLLLSSSGLRPPPTSLPPPSSTFFATPPSYTCPHSCVCTMIAVTCHPTQVPTGRLGGPLRTKSGRKGR